MLLKVKRTDFVDALKRVIGVVDSKAPTPVLSYVRLDVAGGLAKLTGSSLAMSAITSVPAITDSVDGALLFPAQTILQTLEYYPSDIIIIESAENEGVLLRSETRKGKNKFNSLPVSMFPAIDQPPAVKPVEIRLEFLQKFIKKVQFAVPSKEGKLVQPVIQFESTNGLFRAIATDGFRVAVIDETANYGEFTFVIQKDALPLLMNLQGGEKGVVGHSETETNHFFFTDSTTLLVRQWPAKFPNYKSALNLAFDTTAALAGNALKQELQILKPGFGKTPGLYFDLTPSAVDITLNSEASFGDGQATLTQPLEGVATKIRLNPEFLLDYLNTFEGNFPMQMRVCIQRKVALFTSADNYKYFLMQMKDPETETKKA